MGQFNFIYRTICLINEKIYVGYHTTDDLSDGYIGCGVTEQRYATLETPFHRAIRKYKYENFKCEIIEDSLDGSQDQFNEREIFWIKELNAHVSLGGYNLTWGGDGGDTFTHNPRKEEIRQKQSKAQSNQSEETKKKRADKHRGMHRSEETKKHMSIASTGRVQSKETREKQRQSKLGKKQSKETIEKKRKSLKGKKRSVISCKNISEGRKGIVFSEEHIKNLSLSHTGKRQSKETIEKKRKSVTGKNVGKIRTPEMKERWSRSHTGKKLSKESIEKRTATRRKKYEEKMLNFK